MSVQGQFEENFAQRMFVYNYRRYDRYGQPILSLAILGDKQEDWYPKHYSHAVDGCQMSFKFPIEKAGMKVSNLVSCNMPAKQSLTFCGHSLYYAIFVVLDSKKT